MSTASSGSDFAWQWPGTGPTAVSYGLDTEIFDSEKFPHVQTFVREAIQNSLDAREDRTKPVVVRFAFHSGGLGSRRQFLAALRSKKEACGLEWPADWDNGKMSWLVVEDSNSSGLKGDLSSRTSDFWNYWLNFGISNKNGTGRGGRGIGRITFLIASQVSTVIGVTRRAGDGVLAACGMSVLKPVMVADEFKSSYAYLAKSESKSIYDLYENSFVAGLVDAFETTDYSVEGTTGLSLIIPFPHPTLTRDGIIAAAIEHFAPAILSDSLVVEADSQAVSGSTIEAQSIRVAELFPDGPLREDPRRFLHLIRQAVTKPDLTLKIKNPSARLPVDLTEEDRIVVREHFEASDSLTIALEIPVVRHGKASVSQLKAAIARAPKGRKPHDLFFREGMCLPEVSARNAADIDLVVQSTEGELATYLNFCEGKAHLGLIENKEVAAKLQDNGFTGYTLKRFVRRLMDDLRSLVLPDATKPDASVYSGFFSIPKQTPATKKSGVGASNAKNAPSTIKPENVPAPQPRVFIVDDLADGFRIRSNPKYESWPVNVRVEMAYADGSRRPKWTRFDFDPAKLPIKESGCAEIKFTKNVLVCRDCESDFELEITGFDNRRELVTNIRPFRNA